MNQACDYIQDKSMGDSWFLAPLQLMRMLKKSKKIALLVNLLFLSFFDHSYAAKDNEVMPANKTQLSILMGSYSLSAPNKNYSSIGSFTLGFTYRFHEKFSAIASYNNLLTFNTSNLSSVVSGFDVGMSYCFWVCSAMKQKFSNSAMVVSWSNWGLQLGVGFSQRAVMLSTLSVGYSGPFMKAEANYMLGDRFKILGSSQYTTMSNSDRKLSHVTFQLGVGLDFGENVYDASKRPQESQ